MLDPRIKKLLEAGVHFGHQTRRWNPKMKPFIFTARNGIYIIDLKKTLSAIDAAKRKINEVVQAGKPILFVGTKKQAKEVLKEAAERVNVFYVVERWLGGMLTNFHTIRGGVKRLKQIEKMMEDGTVDKLTKKEVISLDRERERLQKVLGGIKEMGQLPGLVYVVDSKKEKIAVAEASKLDIPIVAIIDTNADPDLVDFPIAANDDSIKSIRIITKEIADSVYAAKHGASPDEMAGSGEKAGETEPETKQPAETAGVAAEKSKENESES